MKRLTESGKQSKTRRWKAVEVRAMPFGMDRRIFGKEGDRRVEVGLPNKAS